MDPAVLLACLALAALGVWVWRRSGPARDVETQLRRISLGDAALAERLIQAELTRAPGISRAEAASRAVSRYERDNR